MPVVYDDTGIQYAELKDFTFQNEVTLPTVRLAYREFNPTAQKVALIPTCFRGRINTTLNFITGVLHDYRVIVVALFGNGESSSPSNTENFPSTLDYRDCVRAQHEMITKKFNLASIDVMIGFSMGGQCTYHWAAMYPEMLRNAVIICSSAKTSLHNYQFLEGPKAALSHSIDYNDVAMRSQGGLPIRGLRAFSRAYSAWLTSAEWFEQRLFEKSGFKSLESWSKAGEEGYEDWHPDNLLVMLGMWQRSDIGLAVGSGSTGMPIEQALQSLSTRILLMPCQTDQYFRWEVNEKEVSNLKNGELAVIPSIWGHIGGGGANPEDTKWMDRRIFKFLENSP
jgi:homoserine O-acetyltransferase